MRQQAPSSDAGHRTFVLGLGCERGTPAAELLELAETVLGRSDIGNAGFSAVATLDIRADEPAMRAVARHFGVPLVTYDAARLEAETPRLAHPSDIVFAHTGCHGVAEAAALAAGGKEARLIVEKTKSAHATAAIAESFQLLGHLSWQIDSAASQHDSTEGAC